jgi:CheY-like chemotaxis protein
VSVLFKILLAEGNVQLRTLIKALIETRKYIIVCGEANNGMQAISKTVNLKPDLVVLDFAMSGLNGLQLGTQLSKTYPDLPIILHTFYGFAEIISQAQKAGIREVITKGESGNALLEAIDRNLSKDKRPGSLPLLDIAPDDSEPKESECGLMRAGARVVGRRKNCDVYRKNNQAGDCGKASQACGPSRTREGANKYSWGRAALSRNSDRKHLDRPGRQRSEVERGRSG